MNTKLAYDAENIANIVSRTKTEERGDLLQSVADVLIIQNQFYTATLFEEAAKVYGRKEK